MPQAKLNGLCQSSGITKPAETVENSICTKACDDDAVPRNFGILSSAASERIGTASAMPTLYKAIGRILANTLVGKNVQMARFSATAPAIQP